MENVLVIGANTRSVACSLKKLGYNVYSVDYFGTMDLPECVVQHKSVLKQMANQSCGHFTQNFDPEHLVEMAGDFIDQADFIIPLAGVSPGSFSQKKVMGNKDVEGVENKYKLYKTLKNKFRLPLTYHISDPHEAQEIDEAYPDKNFILKPIQGSGGYKIRELNKTDEDSYSDSYPDSSDLILQERIKGQNISASVLSTDQSSKTILTSQQIIGDVALGQKEPYGYCGNTAPLLEDNGMGEIAEEVVDYLSLVGSNGVDFIFNDDDLFLIEVNPRLQGTLECAEASLGINMLEAHIATCRGTMKNVPTPSRFAVKMIVYARKRSEVSKLNFKGIFDVPAEKVMIEEGEPVCTVISSDRVLENAVYSARKLVRRVYSSLGLII